VHRDPPIGLVWVEGSGAAGLQVAGWLPRRTLSSQLLPLPGRARWYAWSDPIPFELLPAETLDDGEGFLIAADQLFESAIREEPIDGVWRTGARQARLAMLLGDATRGEMALRGLAALGADVALDRSRALAQTALALAGEGVRAREALELVRLLRDWDGRATPESVGSTAYHTYLHVLADTLFAERMGRERFERYLALRALDLESLVYGVLLDAASGGVDDTWSDPEAVRKAVVESLAEAWLVLSFRHGPDPRRWAWGPIHALRFRPLHAGGSRGGPLAYRGGGGPLPYGGGPHAVLAGAYALGESAEGRFDVRVAATARFAIDAGSRDLALVALAPGQSEHPAHPHFDDGVEDWLAGRFALLATRRLEVEDRSVARLVLEPVR
jgi:penicillin amidase